MHREKKIIIISMEWKAIRTEKANKKVKCKEYNQIIRQVLQQHTQTIKS